MNVAIESLTIDGEKEGTMQGCDRDEPGFAPPFAIFSPDLQTNVGGPYASRDHASEAHSLMLAGVMVPYTDQPVSWTVGGKPSPWYDRD